MIRRSRALRGAPLALALALVPASAASADETVSQVVPAGGTISTGSTVSAGDPVQLTLTASSGGTITIIKRTSLTRPPLARGNGEEDDSQPKYLGPRFEITGTAALSKREVLIDAASLPESGYLRPEIGRMANLLQRLVSIQGTRGMGSLRGAYFNDSVERDGVVRATEDFDDLRLDPDDPRGGQAGAPYVFDLATRGFAIDRYMPGVVVPERNGLDQLLRDNAFSGEFACTLKCTITAKVTVSSKVQRALGLKSRVVAQGTDAGSSKGARKGVNQYFTFDVPLKAGVEEVLRRKRVAVIGFYVVLTVNGPDGAQDTLTRNGHDTRFIAYAAHDANFDPTCLVRGISDAELNVFPSKAQMDAAPKGQSGCPDVRDREDPPNEWQ